MDKKEQTKVIDQMQSLAISLEKDGNYNKPMIFLCESNGSVFGSNLSLTALIMLNMVRYDGFRDVIMSASNAFLKMTDEQKASILKADGAIDPTNTKA